MNTRTTARLLIGALTAALGAAVPAAGAGQAPVGRTHHDRVDRRLVLGG